MNPRINELVEDLRQAGFAPVHGVPRLNSYETRTPALGVSEHNEAVAMTAKALLNELNAQRVATEDKMTALCVEIQRLQNELQKETP